MSLRQNLLLAVACALFASFAAGTWITAWQAAHLVRAELSAALETGRRGAAGTLQDIEGSPGFKDDLVRLVSGFDGSRHIEAELAMAGRVVAQSRPAAMTTVPPAWFVRLAAPRLRTVVLPVPGGELRLLPLPLSETGERWSEARRLIGLLALSSGLSAALCFVVAGWALRWLNPLAGAFDRLAQGQGGVPVAEHGPPEIARLASGFNRMQEALARADRENRRLAAQLDRLAEEERAELARDLHDEIGPLLFAITAWATAARLQGMAGDDAAANASLQALEAGAAELQQAVRDLLRRLRDSAPASVELDSSLQELAGFWRGIRPETDFALDVGGLGGTSEVAKAALFRVAQEAISNAMRHGKPAHVAVRVERQRGGLTLTVKDDGTGGDDTPAGTGLGLVGMEERLQSLGGSLRIERGAGWKLTAWVPAETASAGSRS